MHQGDAPQPLRLHALVDCPNLVSHTVNAISESRQLQILSQVFLVVNIVTSPTWLRVLRV